MNIVDVIFTSKNIFTAPVKTVNDVDKRSKSRKYEAIHNSYL